MNYQDKLRELGEDKLFISDEEGRPVAVILSIDEYQRLQRLLESESEAFLTMLASEAVLRRDWDRPEEDEAWADL